MSFTKVAPAGIGTEPGNSILIGDSLLHSTGIDIGSNTGIGVTIRKHGDATFTGIITASAFFGDGSGLEGVSSSGIGTPLSDDDTSSLNKVYYVNQELSIGSTVTVNHPDSAIASYTHYQDLVVKDNADFIVTDGDTFIPDVLGINTASLPNPVSGATGGRIRAGTLTNAGANGAPNFPNGLTGTAATFTTGTFTGNLGVAGVLTYEDVTNVDSVGVITARSGIDAASNLLLKTGGTERLRINSNGFVGINTSSPLAPLHTYEATNNTIARLESGDATCRLQLKDNTGEAFVGATGDNLIFANTSSVTERLRIGPVGQIGIGGANYGSSGQVLTSQGSGSAVQWATPSSITTAGGTMTLGFRDHVSNAVSSTTPTAYYQRIGNMVFCSCDTGAINLSGLNNSQILLVTGCFPITRDNNWTLAGSAYQYTITTNQNSGGASIVPTMGYWLSNTSLYFVIPRVSSTSDNLTVGMCNSNNTRIFMQWHYKVN